jgi:hypothetical protein
VKRPDHYNTTADSKKRSRGEIDLSYETDDEEVSSPLASSTAINARSSDNLTYDTRGPEYSSDSQSESDDDRARKRFREGVRYPVLEMTDRSSHRSSDYSEWLSTSD